MADALEQFREPGERVLYRTPRTWLPPKLRLHVLIFGPLLGLAIATGSSGHGPEGIVILSTLAILVLFFLPGYVLYCRDTQAAVTERRIFWLKLGSRPLDFRSVKLGDVAAVEVFNDGLGVTKTDGTTVVFPHPEYSAEMGLTLASAADLAPPPVPDWKEVLANYLAIAGGVAGSGGTLMAIDHLLDRAGLPPSGFLTIVVVLAMFWAGWLVGEAAVAAVLKRLLGPESFNTWRRRHTSSAKELAESQTVDSPQNWRWRLFDLAVGPLPPLRSNGGGHD